MDLWGLVASANRLRKLAIHSQPPQPDAVVRLQRVLLAAGAHCGADATFAIWFKKALDDFIDKFGNVTRKVDDLTARLQATRRPKGHPKGRRRGRAVSPAAHLAGLYGDDLFRALMTLVLPAGAPAEVCLEVAVAAQRLIMHDQLYKIIDLYEKIVFEGNTTAICEPNFLIFLDHIETLDKLVQEHIDLADAADASSPSTGASSV